ncbi:hypothetical protein DPMN_067199 [Dreissena polymorpha]|uniref:Uncharacterized protein n=2 Tax=Dreissena polymorpha TaxID=45954 RepID=A0A9D3YUV2_DREPO|nr:hypothetical protein DPMN_067199 [Dreissena polymorpha]
MMAHRSRGDSDQSDISCSGYICYTVGALFFPTWLICGSIWVYPNFGKIRADDFIPCSGNITTNCTADCHRPLMDFSLAMVTIDWILTLLAVVCFGFKIRSFVSKQ